jgi:hypothetical protein
VRVFEGTSPFPVLALVAFGFGVLVLLAELQSPTSLLWTGKRVPASIEGGIAFYRYDGVEYSIDVPGEGPGPLGHGRPATVFIDPNEPSRAMLDSPQRWVEAGFVLFGFVVAAVLLATGFVRRSVRRRRRLRAARAT